MKTKIPIYLNLLLIINVFIIIFLNNLGDLFLVIFIGIIIPLFNLYVLIKCNKGNLVNLTKFKKILVILSIFLNIFLFSVFIFYLSIDGIPDKLNALIFAFLIFIIPISNIYFINKNNLIKLFFINIVIKKFLIFLKWFFLIFFIGFIILLISIYISSLSSYKESDFNIPKDFFNTKFGDKDPYSEENGFDEFIKFNELLNNKSDLKYFDILSKCIFDEKYIEEGRCKKDKEVYLNNEISEHDKQIDIEIRNYKNDIKKKDELISKKYIKLDERKIRMLKDFYSYYSIINISNEISEVDDKLNELKPGDINFYKVFDYINDKKAYGEYKILLDNINSIDNNIETIADIGMTIDKINNGLLVDDRVIDVINIEINRLYNGYISLLDFKQYSNDLELYKKNEKDRLYKSFKQFKNFVAINKFKYRRINNKEYILQAPEYSGVKGKTVISSRLIQYSRVIRYIAYEYFEEGKYEKGINILLDFQVFIDNLMNKYESDLMGVLVLISINKVNIEGLEYFVGNYDLSNELKENIKLVLENKIDEGLFNNALKKEHIINKAVFQFLWDRNMEKDENEGYIVYYFNLLTNTLFYSVKESKLITDKTMYDIILNNGNGSKWYEDILSKNTNSVGNNIFELNLNNYIGRVLISGLSTNYSNQVKKEEDMHILRSEMIEKLK